MSQKMKKCVLITGGTSDLGQAICERFVESTLPIVFTYHRQEMVAKKWVDHLISQGADAYAVQCDLDNEQSISELFHDIRQNGLRVHVLINNAGTKDDRLAVQMPMESWRRVMETNVTGVFQCIKSCLPGMMAHKGGSIINVSSIASLSGQAGQANYSASKGALNSLTKSLAREVGPKNIRVNGVAPGYIDSGMIHDFDQYPDAKKMFRQVIDHMCSLRRVGNSNEVANVIYFLASKQSSYINGQTIVVDGGILM